MYISCPEFHLCPHPLPGVNSENMLNMSKFVISDILCPSAFLPFDFKLVSKHVFFTGKNII
jgi:hypothetical protein